MTGEIIAQSPRIKWGTVIKEARMEIILEAQQPYFFRLRDIWSNSIAELFRASLWGIAQLSRDMLQNGDCTDAPVWTKCKRVGEGGGVLHPFGELLTSLKEYLAIWGIAAIVSQYCTIWGCYVIIFGLTTFLRLKLSYMMYEVFQAKDKSHHAIPASSWMKKADHLKLDLRYNCFGWGPKTLCWKSLFV